MTIAQKAERLFETGAVTTLPGNARFLVKGDTDTYFVALCKEEIDRFLSTLPNTTFLCSCKWSRENPDIPCSHVGAAILQYEHNRRSTGGSAG